MRVLVDGLLADDPLDPKKTREYLELLAVENARLSRLIENFLTFSASNVIDTASCSRLHSQSAIVAAAVAAIRDRVPADGDAAGRGRARTAAGAGGCRGAVDRALNLLENALKYTPADKRIVVRASHDGDGSVLFAVEDNGIGIPVREQRRIFRRFYRVDQRLSSETSGVGLGLSIVDLIVRGHRGTVSVRSAPGAGSTFTLRVPCAAGREASTSGMSLPRVLLVEDEPALARGLSDSLRANGFDVTVAADGERGLDAAPSGQPDLILLDVMLPKINGYEICRAVRAQGIDVPIVMLTAKGQEQDVILGLNLGADDYVTKPFRTGELIARARAFLRRRGPARPRSRFGDCAVDLTARKVAAAGAEVELTAKEFALLAYFAIAAGLCAVSRGDPERGVGQRRVRHASQHRPLRHDAARQGRARSASPDLHPDHPRDRLPLRPGR